MYMSDIYTGAAGIIKNLWGLGPATAEVLSEVLSASTGEVLTADMQLIALDSNVTSEVLEADAGGTLSAEVSEITLEADACAP